MERKRKIFLRLILVLILIIVFINIFFSKGLAEKQTIDDFLFLKLLSNGKLNKEDYPIIKNKYEKEYKFKISYKNMDFKSIDLTETINTETLVYEKIAPGTSGSFDILLDSNQDLKYKIIFESKNEKPKNLRFRALRADVVLGDADTLEELSEDLVGYIKKNEKINITIDWYWNFENKEYGESADKQDTKDSENIKRYEFNVYTIGEEIA